MNVNQTSKADSETALQAAQRPGRQTNSETAFQALQAAKRAALQTANSPFVRVLWNFSLKTINNVVLNAPFFVFNFFV